MKSVATMVFAASLAAAQVTYNSTTGTFSCALPGGNYCAGDSLSTNIIIRCNNGVGQPGNCNDNLAGQPPLGVGGSQCYQSSTTAGDAACEKNCVVYAQPSFTLPASVCKPSFTASSSASGSTAPPASSTPCKSSTSSVVVHTSQNSSPPLVTSTTVTNGVTTTICPSSSSSSYTTMSTVTCSGSGSSSGGSTTAPPSNGTIATATTSKVPIGPTTTGSSPSQVVTAGAAVHKAGGALAVAGLVAAYFI